MLSQDQNPPPKAVNIIRPSSPLFHYLKQRPSTTALNHHYQQQQQSRTKVVDPHASPTGGTSYSTSTSSSSSSPSTLSTLSGGSGANGNYNKLPPPTILNSSSLGFGFFQAQQNSTTSPTWFKSSTSPPIPSHHYSINNSNNATTTQITTVPSTNPKALPTTGFMNSFSPRFFRVPQQSIDETTSFLRRQPSLSDIQDHHDHPSADQRIHHNNLQHNRQETDDEDGDFDSIDGDTDTEEITDTDGFLDDDDDGESSDLDEAMMDSDYESQDNDDYTDEDDLPIKVVARIKNGTIMNGKGEFVNKGMDDRASHSSWLDEARASRKIADLEIEKTSLMALNATLESKVAQQEARIAKLEKQLHTNEWPLSPVSDKDMEEDQSCFEKLISTEILTEDEIANDHVFQRLRCMLLGLIDQAEEAVRQKTKSTGRVLTLYNGEQELIQDDIITLEGPPTLLKPSTRITPFSATQQQQQQQPGTPTPRRQLQLLATQHKRPLRRVSDAQDNRHHQQPSSSVATTRKRTPMERSLSRASSPAVLVSTDINDVSPVPSHALRPGSPRPFSPPMQRSATRPRPSHLRKSQDLESPKWHY